MRLHGSRKAKVEEGGNARSSQGRLRLRKPALTSLHSGAAWSMFRSRPLVPLLLLGLQCALLGNRFSQGAAEAQPQPPGGEPNKMQGPVATLDT